MSQSDTFVYPSQAEAQRRARNDRLATGLFIVADLLLLVWHRDFRSVIVVSIIAAAILLVWLRRSPPQYEPQLVVSREGLDGTQVRNAIKRALPLSDIIRVEAEDSAVVVTFAPEDLASDMPAKRISQIRLIADEVLGVEQMVREISARRSYANGRHRQF